MTEKDRTIREIWAGIKQLQFSLGENSKVMGTIMVLNPDGKEVHLRAKDRNLFPNGWTENADGSWVWSNIGEKVEKAKAKAKKAQPKETKSG